MQPLRGHLKYPVEWGVFCLSNLLCKFVGNTFILAEELQGKAIICNLLVAQATNILYIKYFLTPLIRIQTEIIFNGA